MYIELHCHSAYSFLDGASLPEELAGQAEALGYTALALTDHNGVYGSMEFAQQAQGRGIQPITGAEITLDNGTHLTLLVETAAGYANLCRLLSTAHQESERNHPHLPRARLQQHAEGLIALTGCRNSETAAAVDRGDLNAAEAAVSWLRELFGPQNLIVEMQQNFVHGDTARIRALNGLAQRLELQIAATNNVHYHCRERHRLQDVMVSIRRCSTLDNSHQFRRANSEFFLKPPEEMARLFEELPQAVRNTLRIAERCQGFNITQDLAYTFPDFQREGDEPADAVLARICRGIMTHRYAGESEPIRRQARQRLYTELDLIRYHGLAGFFLVYRELLELAKEIAARLRGSGARGRFELPPGRGRGSSVSSIVCYLIGLSPVDPVKAGLSLGRFLNKELASVPDIDLDFPRDIREELILAVHRRYGAEHVAMVAAFPTYRLRSAVRDIGKALGLPAGDIDRLARLAESRNAASVEEEMRRLPGFEQALQSAPWQQLIALARELQGFPRHISQHSGGVIISSRPLVEIVPVECSRMEGRLLCQWDKDSCDDARFIKIDFLALGMLSAVEETLNLIEVNQKPPVDLSRIDFNDSAVYDRICAGDTVGVFQIESRAQIQMLPRTQPRNLEDLAVEVAIVRPGPIVGGAVNPYIRRRERLRQDPNARVFFEHALLIPALKDTLGVILFQDQVLAVCQAMAGFSVGRAEALRRVMSRRRSREAMEQFQEEFVTGARRRGVPKDAALRVFQRVLGFSQYGFPKSHAAAFAILSYQSTWLCHYYPAEFVAALLNNQPMGFYSRDVLLKDAQRHGVCFRRPEINDSDVLCAVSGDTVQIGLSFVDGIGLSAAKQIVAERDQGGPFRSLPDFMRRTPLPFGAAEKLVEAGAFDSFGMERRALLWQLGVFARTQGWMAPNRPGMGSRAARAQTSLSLPTGQYRVPLPVMNPWEKLLTDYRLLEMSPDGHPMALLRPILPKGIVTAAQLRQIPDGKIVHIAGIIVSRQRPLTARGFVFLLAEDESGLVNVVVSPALYERRRTIIRGEPMIWLRGTAQHREGSLNLIAIETGSLLDALRDIHPDPEDPATTFLNDLRRAAPPAHQWR